MQRKGHHNMKNRKRNFGIRLVIIFSILSAINIIEYSKITAVAARKNAKVLLTSYEVTKGKVIEGGSIELALTFENASKNLDAEDIVISMETADSLIYPVYGESNQIYIDKIPVKGKKVVKVKCDIAPSLKEAHAIKMNFTIEYTDKNNRSNKNNTFVLLPAVQECVMSIKSLSIGERATKGSKLLISVVCANIGIVEIQNVVMNIEGDILEDQKSVNIGNIAVNGQQAFDSYVNFQSTGTQILKINFKYTDAEGHKFKTEVEEYKVEVEEGIIASIQPSEEAKEKIKSAGGISLWKVCMLGVGAIVCILLIVFFIKRKKP